MTDIWEKKYNIIKTVVKENSYELAGPKHVHYTSLEVLFSILDNDSFWISNARFSNDSTEESLVKITNSCRDDYIICFCDSSDQLSQWRGYCHGGGASIDFNMQGPLKYSVLHTDYEMTKKYELYENVPLPVIYVNDTPSDTKSCLEELEYLLEEHTYISRDDIIPYIKNAKFYEERESRMSFENINGRLSNCIRFRSLKNGVKIPYMIVKQGDSGRMFGTCATDASIYSDDEISKLSNSHRDIWIEEGSNQESVFFDIKKYVDNFAKKNPRMYKTKIYCHGHLPIEKITVAPTYDRERVAEQIQSFCASKYWLRQVEVVQSEIPYIQSSF